jgi:carboxymethylenebutenolidase
MCFDFDSRPPLPPADLLRAPIAGGAAPELLELTSADASRFSAALALTDDPGGAGVLILPDVRGLYPFYSELAERFAQAGHPAIAIDFFGRSAGLGPRTEDFEYMPHVMQLKVPQIQADAHAAMQALRERAGVTSVACVGFCLGGMQSFLAATSDHLSLACAVGFYGVLDGSRFGFPSPLEKAAEVRCPLLGLFGQRDEAIPVEQVNEFGARLSEAGITHEIQVYPGAPHSFFDRKQHEFAEASEDAWRRTLSFIECHAPAAQPAA